MPTHQQERGRLRAALLSVGAVVLLVLAGAAAGSGSDAAKLAIRDESPLTVQGAHFQPRELVKLTAVYEGRHTRQVRSTAAGTFTVRFRLSIRKCRLYRVVAHGDAGSHALYRSPVDECNPPGP